MACFPREPHWSLYEPILGYFENGSRDWCEATRA